MISTDWVLLYNNVQYTYCYGEKRRVEMWTKELKDNTKWKSEMCGEQWNVNKWEWKYVLRVCISVSVCV